ncbi:cation diffusion facilitator family transporter [Azospirillum sp. ST 5-10]|uniref:cation diffusion facilitator family transporter n=1 Tax=unclassified Azospirillum TaxID=2630922 RepID=UPI003F4A20A7
MAATKGSLRVIYAALIGNLLIAVTKFAAAAVTGSSAMLSEGVHSVVDTANEVLLLYGLRRAARPPDAAHPLGHGRELYFWSFIVSLLIFALGAGVSAYEGVRRVLAPEPIDNVAVNYAVLGFSVLFEGFSWRIAVKEFRATKGDLGYVEAVRRSKDPTTFMVLFEDSAALIGLFIALAATAAAEFLDLPVLDGVASLAIAAVLATTALFLARESKGLLIGEAADPGLLRAIKETAQALPGVRRVEALLSVHLAPRQVVVALDVDFADTLSVTAVESAVLAIERCVKQTHPEIATIFVRPRGIAG